MAGGILQRGHERQRHHDRGNRSVDARRDRGSRGCRVSEGRRGRCGRDGQRDVGVDHALEARATRGAGRDRVDREAGVDHVDRAGLGRVVEAALRVRAGDHLEGPDRAVLETSGERDHQLNVAGEERRAAPGVDGAAEIAGRVRLNRDCRRHQRGRRRGGRRIRYGIRIHRCGQIDLYLDRIERERVAGNLDQPVLLDDRGGVRARGHLRERERRREHRDAHRHVDLAGVPDHGARAGSDQRSCDRDRERDDGS